METTVLVVSGKISENLQSKLDEIVKQIAEEIGNENVEKIGFPRPRGQK